MIEDNRHISVTKKYPIPEGVLYSDDWYHFKFILDKGNLDRVRYADWPGNIPLLPREIVGKLKLTANLHKIAEDMLKHFAKYKKAERAFDIAKAKIEVCKV